MKIEYALVEIPEESNLRVIIKVSQIYGFDNFNTLNRNQVYRFKKGDRTFKCRILQVAGTKEALENYKGRISRPKIINPSSFESSDEEESVASKAKTSRKKRKFNETSIKKQRTEEIVQAYQITLGTTEDVIAKKPGDVNTHPKDKIQQIKDVSVSNDGNVEEENSGSEVEGSGAQDERYDNSHATYDSEFERRSTTVDDLEIDGEREEQSDFEDPVNLRLDNNQTEPSTSGKNVVRQKTPSVPNNVDLNVNQEERLISELREKCRQQELQAKKWKQHALLTRTSLEKRQKTQNQPPQQPLQQQPQQLSRQLPQQRQPLQQQPRRQYQLQQPPLGEQLQNENDFNDPNNNVDFYRNDQFHIGDNIFISSFIHREADDADTPSKFITIMAHAIWDEQTLSKRVIRAQSNTGRRKVLSPRKKELLSYHFEKFLNNRNYSNEKIRAERKNLNTYLGRAITSAKNKQKQKITKPQE